MATASAPDAPLVTPSGGEVKNLWASWLEWLGRDTSFVAFVQRDLSDPVPDAAEVVNEAWLLGLDRATRGLAPPPRKARAARLFAREIGRRLLLQRGARRDDELDYLRSTGRIGRASSRVALTESLDEETSSAGPHRADTAADASIDTDILGHLASGTTALGRAVQRLTPDARSLVLAVADGRVDEGVLTGQRQTAHTLAVGIACDPAVEAELCPEARSRVDRLRAAQAAVDAAETAIEMAGSAAHRLRGRRTARAIHRLTQERDRRIGEARNAEHAVLHHLLNGHCTGACREAKRRLSNGTLAVNPAAALVGLGVVSRLLRRIRQLADRAVERAERLGRFGQHALAPTSGGPAATPMMATTTAKAGAVLAAMVIGTSTSVPVRAREESLLGVVVAESGASPTRPVALRTADEHRLEPPAGPPAPPARKRPSRSSVAPHRHPRRSRQSQPARRSHVDPPARSEAPVAGADVTARPSLAPPRSHAGARSPPPARPSPSAAGRQPDDGGASGFGGFTALP